MLYGSRNQVLYLIGWYTSEASIHCEHFTASHTFNESIKLMMKNNDMRDKFPNLVCFNYSQARYMVRSNHLGLVHTIIVLGTLVSSSSTSYFATYKINYL